MRAKPTKYSDVSGKPEPESGQPGPALTGSGLLVSNRHRPIPRRVEHQPAVGELRFGRHATDRSPVA
jgi:hypothetical protein